MKNFDWCVYTYRHRRTIEYLAEKLILDKELRNAMQERIAVHDMDKVVMYQTMEQYPAQMIHVETQPHHLECKNEKTFYDYVETVLDYESAPYTKPDKPLNAFDFVRKLQKMDLIEKETAQKLFGIMNMFGIDHSGTVKEDVEGQKWIQNLPDVTEEMILEEIDIYLQYLKDNKEQRVDI